MIAERRKREATLGGSAPAKQARQESLDSDTDLLPVIAPSMPADAATQQHIATSTLRDSLDTERKGCNTNRSNGDSSGSMKKTGSSQTTTPTVQSALYATTASQDTAGFTSISTQGTARIGMGMPSSSSAPCAISQHHNANAN